MKCPVCDMKMKSEGSKILSWWRCSNCGKAMYKEKRKKDENIKRKTKGLD
ncbi:MAG TPA: hypothetical protein VMX17_14565 [Candidatus Glassbacteria bacterium]|nr:hypothetical protein [Candidatus Glassbacteria bacterium]